MTIFVLKLTLCWGFFALLYALLLRQETFFRANRVYLLGTALLGIGLALWPAEQLPVPTDDSGLPVVVMPEFSVGLQVIESVGNTWESVDYLWVIYWIGLSLTLARMLWGVLTIIKMAIQGRSERLADGCLLVETQEAKVPFSFFRWVFVPAPSRWADDPENRKGEGASHALMLAHERAHVRGWHSVDVLLVELLCAVFWFHPLAHWYRRALRTVHEYLADAEAARLSDKKQYGLLLIGQSQSGMPIAFANHFFQSPLKQRLIMLTKKASAPAKAVKFGLVAPLALLFAMLFRQAPAIAQVVDEKHRAFVRELESKGWMNTDTIVTFDPNTYEETVQLIRNSVAPTTDENGKLVYQYTEVEAQFPGGAEAMNRFLAENVRYPEYAQKNKVGGTVSVNFVVDEHGNVLRPKGQTDMPNDAKRPLIEEAERVVKSMPKWIPAQHKGKKVSCSLCIPVTFSLGSAEENVFFPPPASSKTVTVEPQFPGDLFQFLRENIKYPESARSAMAQGTVYLEFMVKENGALADIQQINANAGLHPDLVAEALRVVRAMPPWKPAMKDGKVVKTKYTLPIQFKLDDTKEMDEVDALPAYPGGQQELYKLLTNNVIYPEAAKRAGAEGTVVISFVVEKDGSLSTFETVKSPRQDFSDEVIRVIKKSPQWSPAMKDGKAVKVKYTLPFKFKLS